MSSLKLHTTRLALVPATVPLLDAEIIGPQRVGELLGAAIPQSWPPGQHDLDAIRFFRDRLLEGGAAVDLWYAWYAVTRGDDAAAQTVVGTGGYFGPPNAEGIVELGYSIAEEHRGRGYASELVEALVHRACAEPAVTQVIAHTTRDNVASIRVLMKCGFAPGESGETDRLLFRHQMAM